MSRSTTTLWRTPCGLPRSAKRTGCSSAEASQRSAIIYSLIESCRRRGIDPHAYLRDVLTRLPHLTNRQIREITPKAWAKDVKIEALKTAA